MHVKTEKFQERVLSSREYKCIKYVLGLTSYPGLTSHLKQLTETDHMHTPLYYCGNEHLDSLIRDTEGIMWYLMGDCKSLDGYFERLTKVVTRIHSKILYRELNYLSWVYYIRVRSDSKREKLNGICVTITLDLMQLTYGDKLPLYFNVDGELYVTDANIKVLSYEFYSELRTSTCNGNRRIPHELRTRLLTSKIRFRTRAIMSVFVSEADYSLWSENNFSAGLRYLSRDVWKSNAYLRELISQRTRFATNTVRYKIGNLGKCTEVVLREKLYTDGQVILLAKCTFNGESSMHAVYDVGNEVFFCCISDRDSSEMDDGMFNEERFENFILQLYLYAISDFRPTSNRLKAVKLYSSEDEFKRDGRLSQTGAWRIDNQSDKGSHNPLYHFEGKCSLLKEIDPHFRRLPEGYEASEDAYKKASLYGFSIPDGYTFITGFDRVYWVES